MLFSLSAFSRGIGRAAAGCAAAAGCTAAAAAARFAFTASTIFLTADAVVAPALATLPATFATFVIVSLFLEIKLPTRPKALAILGIQSKSPPPITRRRFDLTPKTYIF